MNREVVMARALLRDLKTIPNIISISRIVLGDPYRSPDGIHGAYLHWCHRRDHGLLRRHPRSTPQSRAQLGAILDQYADMIANLWSLMACTY